MPPSKPLAEALNPDGREIVLEERAWGHIVLEHPDMAQYLEDMMAVVRKPSHREPDPRPGRERYFGRGGPQAWIRVVTELAGGVDRVVTAFPQSNDPRPETDR